MQQWCYYGFPVTLFWVPPLQRKTWWLPIVAGFTTALLVSCLFWSNLSQILENFDHLILSAGLLIALCLVPPTFPKSSYTVPLLVPNLSLGASHDICPASWRPLPCHFLDLKSPPFTLWYLAPDSLGFSWNVSFLETLSTLTPPYTAFLLPSQTCPFCSIRADLKVMQFVIFVSLLYWILLTLWAPGAKLCQQLIQICPVSPSVPHLAGCMQSICELSKWLRVSLPDSVPEGPAPDLQNAPEQPAFLLEVSPLCLDFPESLHLTLVPRLLWKHMLFKHFKGFKSFIWCLSDNPGTHCNVSKGLQQWW